MISRGILIVIVSTILTGTTAAAEYPERPVRLIVPWPPGSGPDVTARVVATELARQMGKTIVVDNRPESALTG